MDGHTTDGHTTDGGRRLGSQYPEWTKSLRLIKKSLTELGFTVILSYL